MWGDFQLLAPPSTHKTMCMPYTERAQAHTPTVTTDDNAWILESNTEHLVPHAPAMCSSPNACEYAFHGRNELTQCCPHGITKKQGPPEDCCMDDLEKTPYRVEYVASAFGEESTAMDFQLRVVNVSGIDYDLYEPAVCDKMSLDYAQIQLCEWPWQLCSWLRSSVCIPTVSLYMKSDYRSIGWIGCRQFLVQALLNSCFVSSATASTS